MTDVWEMFQVILEGRKRREVDPTLAVLRECVAEGEESGELDGQARARLLEMLGFFEMTTSWYEQVRRMPRSALTRFVKMGSKVAKLLEATS
jgi:DNA-binding transcriptional regulator GbsR (MarR family)